MTGEKTYVFGDGGSNALSLLGPLMQSKGIDSGTLALLNNGNGFGGGNWIWVIFLALLWGRGGFGGYGNGGEFLASQMNNDYGRDVLLQAINGNGTAISQLATTINCDVNAIQGSLCDLRSQIQAVGSTVGLSGQQVINAIQAGQASLAAQLANCCCDVKTAITTQGYENRIATSEQTAVLAGKIDAQTNLINDKFCALEMREMQNKIDALRDEKLALQTNISQRAQNEFIATSLYPISTSLTELRAEFDCFKSKLPQTVTIPYSPLTAIPNCVAAQYGVGPYGNYGWNTNSGSLWG